jgi:hypothetical protein
MVSENLDRFKKEIGGYAEKNLDWIKKTVGEDFIKGIAVASKTLCAMMGSYCGIASDAQAGELALAIHKDIGDAYETACLARKQKSHEL